MKFQRERRDATRAIATQCHITTHTKMLRWGILRVVTGCCEISSHSRLLRIHGMVWTYANQHNHLKCSSMLIRFFEFKSVMTL